MDSWEALRWRRVRAWWGEEKISLTLVLVLGPRFSLSGRRSSSGSSRIALRSVFAKPNPGALSMLLPGLSPRVASNISLETAVDCTCETTGMSKLGKEASEFLRFLRERRMGDSVSENSGLVGLDESSVTSMRSKRDKFLNADCGELGTDDGAVEDEFCDDCNDHLGGFRG